MSLYILDTDILSLFQRNHPVVKQNCDAHLSDLAITVIAVEEQLSGWYALIRQAKTIDQLVHAYQRLADTVRSLAPLRIFSFSRDAVQRYETLKKLKLSVRKMDLYTAAIALENSGTLVTRNLVDFKNIPGLQVEDWSC